MATDNLITFCIYYLCQINRDGHKENCCTLCHINSTAPRVSYVVSPPPPLLDGPLTLVHRQGSSPPAACQARQELGQPFPSPQAAVATPTRRKDRGLVSWQKGGLGLPKLLPILVHRWRTPAPRQSKWVGQLAMMGKMEATCGTCSAAKLIRHEAQQRPLCPSLIKNQEVFKIETSLAVLSFVSLLRTNIPCLSLVQTQWEAAAWWIWRGCYYIVFQFFPR